MAKKEHRRHKPGYGHRTGGPRALSNNPDHHLRRVDDETTATHAWKVTVKRRSKAIWKYFSDGVYGSERAAYRAALDYRDSLMKRISSVNYAMWRRHKDTGRNTSGVVGVARYTKTWKSRTGRVTENPVWQVFWHDADRKRHIKSFSVRTHGEAKAKALAIAMRRRAMHELRAELARRGIVFGASSD